MWENQANFISNELSDRGFRLLLNEERELLSLAKEGDSTAQWFLFDSACPQALRDIVHNKRFLDTDNFLVELFKEFVAYLDCFTPVLSLRIAPLFELSLQNRIEDFAIKNLALWAQDNNWSNENFMDEDCAWIYGASDCV